MKKIICLCAVIVLLTSCINKNESNKVIIKGTVLTDNLEEVEVGVIENPILGDYEFYTAKIDSTSQFTIEIPLEKFTAGRIIAGRFSHILCFMPGDCYTVEIEEDTIDFDGKGGAKNNFLYSTEIYGTSIWRYYSNYNNGDLTPVDFLKTMNEFKQKRLDYLQNYKYKRLLEPEFINYYETKTQVIYEGLILNYPRRYAYKSGIDKDSLQLSDEYTIMNQLNSIMDDSKVITSEYINNVVDLLYSKTKSILENDRTLNFSNVFNSILLDSLQGKTREYTLANRICSDLSHSECDSLLINRFNALEKDSVSILVVHKALDKYNEKENLIGQPLHPAFAETILVDTSNTKLTFGEMMKKYKGNVVYLDIWSLNCGPCRAAMPHSQKLHKRLEDLPVEFVYIAQDRPTDDVWDRIFEVSMTKHNQYRTEKYSWGTAKMLEFMEINWVPCYMIFDKEGCLVNYSANRPYIAGDNIVSKLEKNLRELAEE